MTFAVPGYRIVRPLGARGGTDTWLAEDLSTGDSLVLQRVDAGDDVAARDQLRREAAVLVALEHPHLLRLRTVVTLADALVLVRDHAPGGSLDALLADRGTMEPGEVVTVASPLAGALAAVHARGVVHGDVGPPSVLFTADGRPLLADVGLSRLVDQDAGGPGVPGFIDPAVAHGLAPSAASDIYGLAATCYAALVGEPPNAPVRPGALAEAGVPVALATAVESALALDPARRPSAVELAVALFDAFPPEPVRLAGTGSDTGPASGGSGGVGPDVPMSPVVNGGGLGDVIDHDTFVDAFDAFDDEALELALADWAASGSDPVGDPSGDAAADRDAGGHDQDDVHDARDEDDHDAAGADQRNGGADQWSERPASADERRPTAPEARRQDAGTTAPEDVGAAPAATGGAASAAGTRPPPAGPDEDASRAGAAGSIFSWPPAEGDDGRDTADTRHVPDRPAHVQDSRAVAGATPTPAAGRVSSRWQAGRSVEGPRPDTAGGHAGQPSTGGRSRRGPILAAVAVVAAVGLAIGAGVVWAGLDDSSATPLDSARPGGPTGSARPSPGRPASPSPPAPSSPPAAATSASAPAWPAVLARLDRVRAEAYASGDGRRLAGVYAPGSPAGARDAQTLARLTAAGLRARGLRLRVLSATQTRLTGDRASLRVVDRLEPYTLVTAGGRVVGTRPGRTDTTWVVTLVRVGDDWQLWDIVRTR